VPQRTAAERRTIAEWRRKRADYSAFTSVYVFLRQKFALGERWHPFFAESRNDDAEVERNLLRRRETASYRSSLPGNFCTELYLPFAVVYFRSESKRLLRPAAYLPYRCLREIRTLGAFLLPSPPARVIALSLSLSRSRSLPKTFPAGEGN